MKKVLLLFAFLSCMVFANAETSTLTLEKETQAQSSFTQSTGNVSWNFDLTGSTYLGWDNNKGLQLGKSAEPCTAITATSTGLSGYTISKVTVNTSGASSINATLSVKVGETSFLNGTSESCKLTSSATDVTFLGSAKGEVTLSYSNSSKKAIYVKSITVEYTAADDNRETATLTWSAATAETTLGATDFTAPTLTVTPEAAASEVVYSSSNESVAKFENGEFSILAAGKTTITAAISNSEKYKDASATYTLKVVDPNAPAAEKFVLVTDASTLVNGQQIIIVSKNNNAALGPQSGNNCPLVEVTKKDNGTTIEPNDNVQIITLESTTTTSGTNCFAFNVGGEYLYAASSSKNYLKTQPTLDNNAKATIEINSNTGVATIIFQGTNTNKVLRYNNSAKVFSCYASDKASNQQDVQIFASNYSYTGTISLGEAYSYNEYSKANVLTFTATISKNGTPIDKEEKANYEVYLGETNICNASETYSHFAYNKDSKFSLKNGDRTIALDVEWPDLDAVLPTITEAKYITYSDDDTRVDAKFFIEASDNSYNWTVKSTDENAIVGWDNSRAFCLYENATPDAINVKITFPFAVTKAIAPLAADEEFDIVTYEPANATELSTAEFAKNESNTEVSGVADVAVDQNTSVEYYNLQGVRVNGDLTPGLYIRRQGNQATKVVVR